MGVTSTRLTNMCIRLWRLNKLAQNHRTRWIHLHRNTENNSKSVKVWDCEVCSRGKEESV